MFEKWLEMLLIPHTSYCCGSRAWLSENMLEDEWLESGRVRLGKPIPAFRGSTNWQLHTDGVC